jgi:hypothetical protein
MSFKLSGSLTFVRLELITPGLLVDGRLLNVLEVYIFLEVFRVTENPVSSHPNGAGHALERVSVFGSRLWGYCTFTTLTKWHNGCVDKQGESK